MNGITPNPRFALWQLGFRPFFAGAALFSLIAVALWMAEYVFHWPVTPGALSPFVWHAHEMIYGYTMAVIAGFLLTAVGNWTGQATLRGWALLATFLLWLAARLAVYFSGTGLIAAAAFDFGFMLALTIGVALPIVRAKQWKQSAILGKLLLLPITGAVFYAGVFGYMQHGVHIGLYGGLYLILALVFTIARRVLPFFIERGVAERFVPRTRRWLDIASLFGVLAWAVVEVFFPLQGNVIALFAAGLFVLHTLRLIDWHTPGIWRQPLLWSLYLGYASLVAGFGLRAWSIWGGLSPFIALHAFAYGGIGLMTLGMMSRVALGHTGRDVYQPPRCIGPLLSLLVLGTLSRVVLPIVDSADYTLWIAVSQGLWIIAFGGFALVYLPLLFRPRIDGKPG